MISSESPGFGVVVDAFSTGARLARHLHAAGWPLLHVRSTAAAPSFLTRSYDPAAFAAEVVHDHDLDATCASLLRAAGAGRLRFVATGTETGVTLSAELAARLGLPGNDPARSVAHRDKYLMSRSVAQAGLAAPETFRARSLDEALTWIRHQGRWPVVLKPAASAGNDKVFICADVAEVRRAFSQISGQVNRLGLRDHVVLVQTWLAGRQYIVNTVSRAGRHCVTDIWADHRRAMSGASNIYDYEDLLPSTGEVEDRLSAYILRVLDALGVQHGPAHSEVMMTEDGPVLIETAARLQGGLVDAPMAVALERTQIALTIAGLTDPARFDAVAATPYLRRAHVRCVNLIADRDGVVQSVPGLDETRRLPSFAAAVGWPAPGTTLRRTVDLLSSPGMVYLCHPEREQIERDYQRIRALEAQGALIVLDQQPILHGGALS